jgi:hypothetical protein
MLEQAGATQSAPTKAPREAHPQVVRIRVSLKGDDANAGIAEASTKSRASSL